MGRAPKPRTRQIHYSEHDPECCVACHRFLGTRQVVIDGRLSWLCERCPSPAEIVQQRNAIRESWSTHERWVRAGRVVRQIEIERVKVWISRDVGFI